MRSMTKVMQRVREDHGKAADVAAWPGEMLVELPGESVVLDEPASESRFVTADGSATDSVPPPSLLPVDDHTVAWDAALVDPVLVAFHDRYSAICEQYRAVRARLLTMNPQRTAQVIAITSSVPAEGKSVSTVNLGLVMAEGGEQRIVIADADFRRASLARMLGVAGAPGLAEVLRGEVGLNEALQATPYPNFKLLPAGEVGDQAYGDLLGGTNTSHALEELRSRFDYTFVDTPPVTTVSDACLLAPHCDGAIMVIKMCATPEPTVQQAVRALQANNVKVLGCLLSQFRQGGTGYYVHYYSSSYYRR